MMNWKNIYLTFFLFFALFNSLGQNQIGYTNSDVTLLQVTISCNEDGYNCDTTLYNNYKRKYQIDFIKKEEKVIIKVVFGLNKENLIIDSSDNKLIRYLLKNQSWLQMPVKDNNSHTSIKNFTKCELVSFNFNNKTNVHYSYAESYSKNRKEVYKKLKFINLVKSYLKDLQNFNATP